MSSSGKVWLQLAVEVENYQLKDQNCMELFVKLLDQLKNSLLILVQIQQLFKAPVGDGSQ